MQALQTDLQSAECLNRPRLDGIGRPSSGDTRSVLVDLLGESLIGPGQLLTALYDLGSCVRDAEQVSRNRCHNEVLLNPVGDIDAQLHMWLQANQGVSSLEHARQMHGAFPPRHAYGQFIYNNLSRR